MNYTRFSAIWVLLVKYQPFSLGPMRIELQEPLHFVISAENPDLLTAALTKVRDLVMSCR